MSVKKLKIEYSDSVFALPRENVMSALRDAGGFELKVLLLAASNDALRADYGLACETLCRELDCTKSALGRALDYWQKAGVMSVSEASEVSKGISASSPVRKATLQPSELPSYSESESADVIESHSELQGIIDACQQILGKIFTPAETACVVSIYDYLKLNDTGFIETLYSYCAANGKTSSRYIEKVAITLHDDGITTTAKLNEYIKARERTNALMSKVRTLIGADSRALSSKEKKTIEVWINEQNFDIDMITRAYEATVDSIGKYGLAYMNRILQNWHDSGIKTVDAVEKSLAAYQSSKKAATKTASGFETDEYFEAALARSQKYLENSKSAKKPPED